MSSTGTTESNTNSTMEFGTESQEIENVLDNEAHGLAVEWEEDDNVKAEAGPFENTELKPEGNLRFVSDLDDVHLFSKVKASFCNDLINRSFNGSDWIRGYLGCLEGSVQSASAGQEVSDALVGSLACIVLIFPSLRYFIRSIMKILVSVGIGRNNSYLAFIIAVFVLVVSNYIILLIDPFGFAPIP